MALVCVVLAMTFILAVALFSNAVALNKLRGDADRLAKEWPAKHLLLTFVISLLLPWLGLIIVRWRVPAGSISPAVENWLRIPLLVGLGGYIAGLCVLEFTIFRAVLSNLGKLDFSRRMWTRSEENTKQTAYMSTWALFATVHALGFFSEVYPWKLYVGAFHGLEPLVEVPALLLFLYFGAMLAIKS